MSDLFNLPMAEKYRPKSFEDYVRLVNEHSGNMRGVLIDIEAGRMMPGGDE